MATLASIRLSDPIANPQLDVSVSAPSENSQSLEAAVPLLNSQELADPAQKLLASIEKLKVKIPSDLHDRLLTIAKSQEPIPSYVFDLLRSIENSTLLSPPTFYWENPYLLDRLASIHKTQGDLPPVYSENPFSAVEKSVISADIAYNQCTARIAQVFSKLNGEILSPNSELLNRKVASELPPVSHVYSSLSEKKVQEDQNREEKSPRSNKRRSELKNKISDLNLELTKRKKDSIVMANNFQKENPRLLKRYLEIFNECKEEGNYAEALASCESALRHTKDWRVYAEVPLLYEKLDQTLRALLSRIHLSLLQLEAGDLADANQTLDQCKIEGLIPAKISLKLKGSPTQEVIAEAMKTADTQVSPRSKMFIYQHIIAHAPASLDAYIELISRTQESIPQQRLLVKALGLARQAGRTDLEAGYRKAATTLTSIKWKEASRLSLLPYPEELRTFLEEDCTIWPGRKRWETHIVVPLFSHVNFNNEVYPLVNESGRTEPLTPQNHFRLRSCSWKLRVSQYNAELLQWEVKENLTFQNMPLTQDEFRWGVLTYDLIPGTTTSVYSDLKELLPTGYQVPSLFDVERAVFWEKQRSNRMYFSNETFTYCQEGEDAEGRIIVGDQFMHLDGAPGLELYTCALDPLGFADELKASLSKSNPRVGVAGWRMFDYPVS